MSLQYIKDNQGNPTGVFIPIQEWEMLTEKFDGIEGELEEMSNKEILQGVQEAVQEINLIKKGKLKARDAKDLLNEL